MKHQDRKLVRKALRGDSKAFDTLDSIYRGVAQQEAVRLVGDPFEAEDVVQEAMFRAYTKLAQLSDPSRFGPWLASIVHSVALDHIRRRLRRRRNLTELEALHRFLLNDAVSDGSDYLEDVLSSLSPVLAEVVRLRAYRGLHLSEIAGRLQIPLGTVKRRLHDAKKQIRRLIVKTFDEKTAWEIVDSAGKDIADLPGEVKRDIIGVAVGGDLIRGDFIPNNSSLLVFPLISNRKTLYIYDTPAYGAITEIFDKRCKPYFDCTEAPTVWQNLTIDEIHLPVSAESFDPPTIPQPHWYSIYLFDLIDYHHVIYGDDFIKDLYRPDPRKFTRRMGSEMLRIMRSKASAPTRPPAGFGTVVHWQALKMVRILQLYFSAGVPTIAWMDTLSNYREHVPAFPSKSFGEKLWKREMEMRYPVDRKEPSTRHVNECRSFIEEGCDLLV